MATLVSPGTSVTVTDDSFFIPASAPTVPLIFMATAERKSQPNGTEALGTYEYDTVRTVTSLQQSVQLYGIPRFLEDEGTGAQFHGDARNEYGLFALNQFLGVGNRAYVVRANVNLNDNLADLREYWQSLITDSTTVVENLVNATLNEFNNTNGYVSSDPEYKTTVTATELYDIIVAATPWLDPLTGQYNFKNISDEFLNDQATGTPATGLPMYTAGYDMPADGDYLGIAYILQNIDTLTYSGGGIVPGEFTPQEAGEVLLQAADAFQYTKEFLFQTSLGENDAARRTAIREALEAQIGPGSEAGRQLRSESYEYNLVLCPGWPEVVDQLLALVTDIKEEALIIADTPMNREVDGITNPATGWGATNERIRSTHVAYYYPHALASNLDGKEVVVAASGVALRTYTISDNNSFLWFAPAGLRRGLISGISNLGYVSGQLGGPTEFVPLALNQGQRDALYAYGSGGDINPLVFFPGQGFVVWGQKTSAPAASAMDRVNVSRLIKYVKRSLRKNTLSFVFQPNDQLTRDNLKSVVDNFLGDLVVKRGLYDYATVCDESNNTPDRIDRNEMYVDIALKPTKAAEFLYIPIRIVNTGDDI